VKAVLSAGEVAARPSSEYEAAKAALTLKAGYMVGASLAFV
jgi:hypothetical protein